MRVFFVRHGQSEDNRLMRACGWSDCPLSDAGREQARAAAPLLKGIRFDRVFSSDLPRAVETAKLVLPGCEPELSDRIREISVGHISGRFRTELKESLGEAYLNARDRHDYTAFGGENDDMISARVFEFMRMLETLKDCENAAVFGHEGTVHQMLNYVLGVRVILQHLRAPNCSVSVFCYENNWWKLEKFSYNNAIIPTINTIKG